ncbi:WD repeat and SOCS box-containing protein 2 isoform X1 [Bufo gargarizans]|uniref:WD repeat and SOCS box-containing protein 2 isoform X1 n=1 Tax=Bufo gargarizans TaxID=30331 RepID=UPI001CF21A9F|nr:WD repeat and SOCS box-containing protein 2 isoform X1 [Bufo gargarizans]
MRHSYSPVTSCVSLQMDINTPVHSDVKEDTPVLLAELRPARDVLYDWKSSCETWSIEFSPDGSWFAWSQGHGIIKLIPWPLEEEDLRPSSCRAKSQCHKGPEVKRKGSLKEKILDCGQIVWSLAFGCTSAPAGWKLWPLSRQDAKSSEPWLLLATGLSDGHVKVWEVHTGRLLFNLSGHQDVVRDLSFTKNGSLTLVTASRDKTLRIWDLKKDGKLVQVLSGHVQWVYCCSISQDCSMLCSAAGENVVLLWSMRSYTLIRKLVGHQNSVVSCDFSPDSALLVTASYDTTLILWDPYTGEKLRQFLHVPLAPDMDYSSVEPQLTALRSVCFSPEGLHLASLADDRFLRVWSLELQEPLTAAPVNNGLCCTFFPQGGILATGNRDGHVQFWTSPRILPSLRHLCRMKLRHFLTTYQVLALPIPGKIKDFLIYRTNY